MSRYNNAKTELLQKCSGATIDCACIRSFWTSDEHQKNVKLNRSEPFEIVRDKLSVKLSLHDEDEWNYIIFLSSGYNEAEYNEFLECLDLEYKCSYGTQYFFGTVWLKDGTWLTREEYDGSEWWKHVVKPDFEEMKTMYLTME